MNTFEIFVLLRTMNLIHLI